MYESKTLKYNKQLKHILFNLNNLKKIIKDTKQKFFCKNKRIEHTNSNIRQQASADLDRFRFYQDSSVSHNRKTCS